MNTLVSLVSPDDGAALLVGHVNRPTAAGGTTPHLRPMTRLLLPAILLSAAIGTVQAAGWIVEGRVVGISDGDTITVLDDANTQHKIRIDGIDAPEKGQAFGERSKQSLSTRRFTEQV